MVTINKQKELLNEIVELATELMAEWPSSRNKQKQFILAYVANGFTNGSEAAKRAGYSEKSANTASSNMLNGMKKYEHIPPVIEKIKEAFDKRSSELSIADGTEVLQYYTSVMRGEHKEETLRGLGEGYQEPIHLEVGAKDRLKAAEMLGKYHKLLTDKVETTEVKPPSFLDDIGGVVSD